jgi:hypothetical protein
VQADGAQFVDLVFDAGAHEVTGPGEYPVALVLVTNDPGENLVTVPMTMTVTPLRTLYLPLIVRQPAGWAGDSQGIRERE